MTTSGKIARAGMAVVLLSLTISAVAFERVEAVNFAKQDFVFPDDIQGDGTHLVFLGIAKDQDNGTWQGEELIRWHQSLLEADALPDEVLAWHFAVMESPPFFVKGLIRRAIGETYEGLIPPEQGAVLYIKRLQSFAESAGLPIDGQPTILAYSADAGVTATWRGEVNADTVAAIKNQLQQSELQQTELQDAPATPVPSESAEQELDTD
ncbi:MAG: hypothetical protein HKN56_02065 [Gammaproteobacteria bacterium]|nr:hypothetical protein [Gammaproteobacteria bacterium]NND53737.1 hypothetical protein [Gammaproteobacteria bacterium]